MPASAALRKCGSPPSRVVRSRRRAASTPGYSPPCTAAVTGTTGPSCAPRAAKQGQARSASSRYAQRLCPACFSPGSREGMCRQGKAALIANLDASNDALGTQGDRSIRGRPHRQPLLHSEEGLMVGAAARQQPMTAQMRRASARSLADCAAVSQWASYAATRWVNSHSALQAASRCAAPSAAWASPRNANK